MRTSFGFRIIRSGRRCNLFIRRVCRGEIRPLDDKPSLFVDPGVDVVAVAAIEVGSLYRDKGIFCSAAGADRPHRGIEIVSGDGFIFHE
jgi:hypothetical protein